MSLPFRRSPRPGQRAADPSQPSPEQRAWDAAVILCTLHPVVREVLHPWLLHPCTVRLPDTFVERRYPLSAAEYGDGKRSRASRLLWEELRAIRQTLELPPEAVSGFTRNGLLTVHAIRLRQLERWLWPFYAAREITKLLDDDWP